eukprot:341487_1
MEITQTDIEEALSFSVEDAIATIERYNQSLSEEQEKEIEYELSLPEFERMKRNVLTEMKFTIHVHKIFSRDDKINMESIRDYAKFKQFITSKYSLTNQQNMDNELIEKIKAITKLTKNENVKLKEALALYLKQNDYNLSFVCVADKYEEIEIHTGNKLEKCMEDEKTFEWLCDYINNLKDTERNKKFIRYTLQNCQLLKQLDLIKETKVRKWLKNSEKTVRELVSMIKIENELNDYDYDSDESDIGYEQYSPEKQLKCYLHDLTDEVLRQYRIKYMELIIKKPEKIQLVSSVYIDEYEKENILVLIPKDVKILIHKYYVEICKSCVFESQVSKIRYEDEFVEYELLKFNDEQLL